MRVAVVDIGSNSTRLLVAEVTDDGGVTELERHTTVTRLGQGVDASGALADEAIARVITTLTAYRERIDEHQATRAVAVLTSAVRDAANGEEFTKRVRDEFGLDAKTLTGDEEAQLSFLGATSERDAQAPAPVVVIDIGGGSTEFVAGARGHVDFHVSTQAGVVRMGERHLHDDPPTRDQMQAVTDDVEAVFAAALPAAIAREVRAAIAVAGTATSLAAIAQELEPYDPARVHGYLLTAAEVTRLSAQLARMTLDERRAVPGLDPARAPTIVAGTLLLGAAMRAFGLPAVEVSEHDILRGAALRAAGAG